MEYSIKMQDFLNIINRIDIDSLKKYSYKNWGEWAIDFEYDISQCGSLRGFQDYLSVAIRNLVKTENGINLADVFYIKRQMQINAIINNFDRKLEIFIIDAICNASLHEVIDVNNSVNHDTLPFEDAKNGLRQ